MKYITLTEDQVKDINSRLEKIEGASKIALSSAVESLYLGHSERLALWVVIEQLGGKSAVTLLETDKYAAFKKYCEGHEEFKKFLARYSS